MMRQLGAALAAFVILAARPTPPASADDSTVACTRDNLRSGKVRPVDCSLQGRGAIQAMR